jgi:RNA polymerase primary sigma factor
MREFVEEYGHVPTTAWLAAKLDMPERKVELILRCISEPVPLTDLGTHSPLFEAPEIDPVEAAQTAETTAHVEKLLQAIGDRKRGRMTEKVLRMRYGVGVYSELTLDEIGRRCGLTRERIRQIESKGIKLARIQLGLLSPRGANEDGDEEPDSSESGDARSNVGNGDESHVQPLCTDETATTTQVAAQQGSSTEQGGGTCSISPVQAALLYKAKAGGLQVMSYMEATREVTLVMLKHAETPTLKVLAEELLDAGFQHKPGIGYLL